MQKNQKHNEIKKPDWNIKEEILFIPLMNWELSSLSFKKKKWIEFNWAYLAYVPQSS
jgi:hypothetical protein